MDINRRSGVVSRLIESQHEIHFLSITIILERGWAEATWALISNQVVNQQGL